ncbi:hypothetical protein IWX76_000413 [Pedobacter sp. CAN_A7]|uniref:DUF1579 family protein n=1 Tax=Pedobacter sp. CAN_A7 TaxID=2787722 RepID=UPI0018CBA762
MKRLILAILLTISYFSVIAQQSDPWEEYMTPNEVHRMLSEYAGDFDMEISMWPAEGKDPMKVKVAAKNQMILGGRFLELSQTGTMMDMDYQSVTTIGFNTSGKNMDLITITNMGTGTLSLTGAWNQNTKIATLSGQMISPGGGKVIRIRQILHFIDKNTLIIQNIDQADGQKARKTVEYKLTRTPTIN